MDKRLYDYRRQNGLCVMCGEVSEKGKSRCLWCAQKEAGKSRMRYEENIKKYGDEYRQTKREYLEEWKKKNPEKMETYRKRKPEYNRRYKEGYCL